MGQFTSCFLAVRCVTILVAFLPKNVKRLLLTLYFQHMKSGMPNANVGITNKTQQGDNHGTRGNCFFCLGPISSPFWGVWDRRSFNGNWKGFINGVSRPRSTKFCGKFGYRKENPHSINVRSPVNSPIFSHENDKNLS